jgi:hypothetical protein
VWSWKPRQDGIGLGDGKGGDRHSLAPVEPAFNLGGYGSVPDVPGADCCNHATGIQSE